LITTKDKDMGIRHPWMIETDWDDLQARECQELSTNIKSRKRQRRILYKLYKEHDTTITLTSDF
jgi:hypothetical protein